MVDIPPQARVANYLDKHFSDPAGGLTDVYLQQVENDLLEQLDHYVQKKIKEYAKQRELDWRRLSGDSAFKVGDSRYRLSQSIDGGVLDFRIQSIESVVDSIADAEKKGLEGPVESVELETNGKITLVKLYCHQNFEAIAQDLVRLISQVLQTGYRWMEEEVRRGFSNLSNRLSARLYTQLRKRFLSDDVTQQIWLAIHVDQKTHYLVDTRGQDLILDRAAERVEQLPYSPIEILVEVQGTSVDFDLTHSKMAVERGQSVPQELSEAKYPNVKLQLSEEAVYEAEVVCVQPLIEEGDALLTGTYPPELKERVQPVLSNLKGKYKKIIEEEATRLGRLTKRLQEQTVLPKMTGEVSYAAGQFLRGLVDLPGVRGQ